MATEDIIKKIKSDAKKEAMRIKKDAEKEAASILKTKEQEINDYIAKLKKKGEQQAEIQKKIEISQADQETKRALMQVKETIIEDCFNEAHTHLSNLDKKTYEKTIRALIKQGKDQINGSCIIYPSKDIDKHIAKEFKLSVGKTINATGGILLQSKEGHITIDNTFEGIIKRKKETIRIKVGTLLFS